MYSSWMYDTFIERPLIQSQRGWIQLSWLLFLWDIMPDDVSEGVTDHSF